MGRLLGANEKLVYRWWTLLYICWLRKDVWSTSKRGVWWVLRSNESLVLHRDRIVKPPTQQVVRSYWWELIVGGRLCCDGVPTHRVGGNGHYSSRVLRHIIRVSWYRAPLGQGSTNQPRKWVVERKIVELFKDLKTSVGMCDESSKSFDIKMVAGFSS